MEQATTAFLDYFLQTPNLLIAMGSSVLLGAMHRVFPEVRRHHFWARVAPLAPILLCSALVWIPGAGIQGISVADRIMLGIVLGALSANAHKIFKQSAFGHDSRIRNRKRRYL